jgi:hypothetical protein
VAGLVGKWTVIKQPCNGAGSKRIAADLLAGSIPALSALVLDAIVIIAGRWPVA